MKKLLAYLSGFLTAAIILYSGIALAAPAITQVVNGGTGWGLPGGLTAGTLLTGNGKNPIATTTVGSGLTLSGGVLSASGGSGTVSTSTVPTVGQLAYWTSSGYPSLLGSVATGTATINAPLSGTLTTPGASDSLSISQANTSTNGYLSSTDWNTFNNKQAAISTTWPVTLSGATVAWGGLASSSPISAGLLYATGVNTFASVATSSAVQMSITGNAGTATKLATARTIAGVSFDGTANISLNNNAITNGAGYITSITGGTCTNQFVRSLSTAGAPTCATVANTDLANSTISGVALGGTLAALTAANGTLTFSGSYDGSTARTVGLNLGNANTWTALQQFGNATSTQFSAGSSNQFYINSTGEVTGYDTIYAQSGQLNPMRPLSINVSTTTTWTGTSTQTSLYGDMAAMVAPWTGTITKASCFTDAGTATIELTSGASSTYLPNASTTAGTNNFSLSITKGDKMYLQAGNPVSSMNRANCTFMGYITP